MSFPPPAGINVGNLTRVTPTAMTPATLKVQLGNVGLDCGELNDNDLARYINDVSSQLYDGKVQTFTILKPTEQARSYLFSNSPQARSYGLADFMKSATGNWEVGQNPTINQWMSIFIIMQPAERFQWLYDNRNNNGFTGTIDNPTPSQEKYDNAEAIKQLFVKVGLSSSSTLVEGLKKDSMEAALHNAIGSISDENISDYDQEDSRVMGLLMDYDENTKVAKGLGFLATEWHLKIKDFRRKEKDGGLTHDTTLTIKSRAALYTSSNLICNHFNAVVSQFNVPTTVSCPP